MVVPLLGAGTFGQIPPYLQRRTPGTISASVADPAAQAASTLLSGGSSVEPETPTESDTVLDTAQYLSIDHVPSNVQDNTVVDDVVNNIIVWDGSTCFPPADLDADVITQLRLQVQELLCPMTATQFHNAFVANVNKPGVVCVWQRCFTLIYTKSSKTNNGYFACPECISARRICLVRVRRPRQMGNSKPHVAPLPDAVRPEDANRNQLAYYVLPEAAAVAYATAFAAAAIEQQSSDLTSPAHAPQTTDTSSDRRSSSLNPSRGSLSSSHSPSHTSPGQTSPAQPLPTQPSPSAQPTAEPTGTPEAARPASHQQPQIHISDFTNIDDVFSNILAWDGQDLIPMDDVPSSIVDAVKYLIGRHLVNLDETKFHQAFVATVNRPGIACVWQRAIQFATSDPNGYYACKDCVRQKRVCVVKVKNEVRRTPDRPHLAPLPDAVRPQDATPADPEYWVLPDDEDTSAQS